MIDIIRQLAAARQLVDGITDGSMDETLEHLDRAIDTAIVAAVAAGHSLDDITAAGINDIRPERFA